MTTGASITPRCRFDEQWGGTGAVGEGKEDMTPPRDDLTGIDDFIAEHALARRAKQRHLADWTMCVRQITHPRRPSEFDALGYPEVNMCRCIRPAGHNHGCWCEHDIERRV